jgi:hypothetical protein
LSAYLTENAPQVQGQANTIAGNLNSTYGQVNTDLGNTVGQFNQQVASSYTAPNQQLLSQEKANPTAFASNAGNVSAFQGQLNDVYNGPQNFESTTPYSNIQDEVSQAVTDAGLWNSPAGVTSAYQQAEPNANPGIVSLDSALLQGTPGAMQTVTNAAAPYQNLTGYLANDVTTADQGVANAQQTAQQTAANTQAALTGQEQGLTAQEAADNTAAYNAANTNYQNELNALNAISPNATETADLNTLNTILQTPNHSNAQATTDLQNLEAAEAAATPQVMQQGAGGVGQVNPALQPLIQAGLTPAQIQQLVGEENQLLTPQFTSSANPGNGSAWTVGAAVPLSQYLTGPAPTQAQFTGASPQDIAEAQALNTLAGSNAMTVPNATGNTYTAPTLNFANAQQGLQNDLTAQQQGATALANQIAAQQQAQHVASEGKSGILGDVEKGAEALFPVQTLANYLAPQALGKEV